MNTPTFTPEPPTKPGWYARRRGDHKDLVLVEQLNGGLFAKSTDGSRGPLVLFIGLWCRLVPADEVQMAFNEAVESYYDSPYPSPTADDLWQTSRAKRVMEGEV